MNCRDWWDGDRKSTVELPISVPINQMVSQMKVGVLIIALEGLNIIYYQQIQILYFHKRNVPQRKAPKNL